MSNLVSFSNLIKTDWPEEIFIEGGLLSRGDKMLIGADAKAGKSTLLTTLIRQFLIGGNFLGFPIKKPLKVLLMQAELRESRLKERIIVKFKTIDEQFLEQSFAWNTRGLIMLDTHFNLIKDHLAKIKPDVTIVDPFINFHTAAENDPVEISRIFRKLDNLKEEFNMALILSQHFRKASKEYSDSLLDMIRGSSAFRAWPDTIIAIEGRTQSGYRRLEFDIRNSDTPLKRMIKYNTETKEFDWHDPISLVYDLVKIDMSNGTEVTTNQFVELIIKKCGHIVGKKRQSAFEIKDLLISSQMIHSRIDGVRTLISIT